MFSRHFAALCIASALIITACSDDADPGKAANSSDPTNSANATNNANASSNNSNANASNNASNSTNASNNTSTPDMGSNCVETGCDGGLICNTSSGECVTCSFNEECGANGVCGDDGRCGCGDGFHLCGESCVSDDEVATCGSRCEPCPTVPGATSTCDEGMCAVACPEGQVLNDDGDACVGCASNNDCQDPFASKCSMGTSECVRCGESADCAHLGDTPICDTVNQHCVECVDDSTCGGNSCNRASGECTTTALASVQNCEPCTADSECVSGFACVPMFYDGQVRQSAYCLELKGDVCEAFKFKTDISRTSVDGVAGTFCGVNESLASCEAVLAYGTMSGICQQDSDCPGPGALCEPIDFGVAACTYACDLEGDECDESEFSFCATGNSGIRICGGY